MVTYLLLQFLESILSCLCVIIFLHSKCVLFSLLIKSGLTESGAGRDWMRELIQREFLEEEG